MSEKINWTLNVQVVGGPKISESDTILAEAYDKVQVTIAAGDSDVEVDVQPGGSGQVQFLLISSDQYAEGLTYKVNADSADAVELDGPQVLIGKGAVGLLDPEPKKLFFSNGLAEDASVQILVGRDATP
jgi:hypothetical protein